MPDEFGQSQAETHPYSKPDTQETAGIIPAKAEKELDSLSIEQLWKLAERSSNIIRGAHEQGLVDQQTVPISGLYEGVYDNLPDIQKIQIIHLKDLKENFRGYAAGLYKRLTTTENIPSDQAQREMSDRLHITFKKPESQSQ